MRIRHVIGGVMVLLALAQPAVGREPVDAVPAAHEELSRALEELAGQLHGLGEYWRGHFGRRPGAPGERPLVTLMLGWRDELGLSPAQVEALERIRAEFQREAIRNDADRRLAELDLAALLGTEPVDLGKVEARVREIERLRGDLRLGRIRAIEQGKAQLTPEQRARLDALESGGPARPHGGAEPRAPQRL